MVPTIAAMINDRLRIFRSIATANQFKILSSQRYPQVRRSILSEITIDFITYHNYQKQNDNYGVKNLIVLRFAMNLILAQDKIITRLFSK